MASYNIVNNGKSYTVNGPSGLSLTQAQELFLQQVKTGALEDLPPGKILTSIGQAVGGFGGSFGMATQTLVKAGSLAQTADAVLGPNGVAARAQSVLAKTGFGSNLKPTAPTAEVEVISTQSVVNGIDAADYASQDVPPNPMEGMTVSNVRGVLAQVSKDTGQAVDSLTNNGLGKYAFNAQQLEAAGYIKPGITAKFLAGADATANLTKVLESPSIWTGKDGVSNVNDILTNSNLQDGAQLKLMSDGLSGLKQLGIPVGSLSAPIQGGLAAVAAKEGALKTFDTLTTNINTSVTGITDNFKNIANTDFSNISNLSDLSKLGTSALSAVQGVTNVIGSVTSAVSFFGGLFGGGSAGVNFSSLKTNAAMLMEQPIFGASGTVNVVQVAAAAKRIIGNDKIPDVTGLA